MSYSVLKEYPKCLLCDETPNPTRVNALIAEVTMYDGTPFDSKDPVIVYCCTECYTRGIVTQEDASDALWNRTVFYS